MWKIVTIRRSYHETEEVLVWLRHAHDLLDLLPLLGCDAAISRAYTDTDTDTPC